MHNSIPLDSNIEFINTTKLNPLISYTQIKVCYAGQNRNKTFISDELLKELGEKLPGSPIVGFYLENEQDFHEHDRELVIKEDEIKFVEKTKPYGFVDLNAKVWLQDFLDDDSIVRRYLCTEGYIWTGAYPESKRIIEKGNNQSMEFYDKTLKGNWTKDKKTQERFFIINEALIEKLCILGENIEPCFEGSQIKSHFSFANVDFEEFKNTMYSMINELKDTLDKGGTPNQMQQDLNISVTEPTETAIEAVDFVATNISSATSENNVNEDFVKKDKEDEDTEEEVKKESQEKDSDEKDKKKKEYNLEEIQEYMDLKENFDKLSATFAALKETTDSLQVEFQKLKEFKEQADLKEKQNMINSFYMLDEEDKADVQKNINSYSLDEIESKLAVICVRKKVDFSMNNENKEEEPIRTFNLAETEDSFSGSEWMRAVKETASQME